MSDKPEDNYIDQLFRDSIDNMETEPSDQFWNKAYGTILQNENKAYVLSIRMWRTVAAVLAIAVIALISFNVYTRYTNAVENKVAGQENPAFAANNNHPEAINTTNATNSAVNAASKNAPVVAVNTTQGGTTVQTPVVNNANHTTPNYGSLSRNSSNHTSSAIAYNNNVVAQHNRTHITNNQGPAYNALYLDDRTSITIPAPDKMDANILAMDVDDNSSIGSRHIDEQNTIPAKRKPKFGPRLSVSVFGAQSIAEPIIKNNSTGDKFTASDITGREQQEAAFAFGTNVGYDVTHKLTLQAGCEYRSYKFSLAPTTVNINIGELNSGYSLATSSGIVTMPYIPGYTAKGYDTTATAKGSAARSYISIPLAVKYRFLSDPKVGLYVRAGTSLNVLASNYAKVHVQNSVGEEDVYVYNMQGSKEISLSYMLGFGAVCRLFRGVDLYVEPAYSGAITPNTVTSPITTYSCFFDLTGGLIYHF